MTASSVTVFLVDDDASVLRALARQLTLAGYTVESFSSPLAFLARQVPGDLLGCVVVDLRMKEMSGFELQKALHQSGSTLPLVFLTGHGDIRDSVRAMKNGAVDFLTKPVRSAELLRAVSQAVQHHGEVLKARAHKESLRDRFALLTQRERQVCHMVARGMLNKQIAYELGTVERTVKLHRSRMMEKLGVTSVPELVRLVDRLAASVDTKPEA